MHPGAWPWLGWGLLTCALEGCGGISELESPSGTGGTSSAAGAPSGGDGNTRASGCAAVADRWLTFDSDQGLLTRRIYAGRGDGSEIRALTAAGSQGTIAPDGVTLAYVSQGAIFLGGSSGAGASTLVAGDQPSWSADGERLAYHRDNAVWFIEPAGGSPHKVIECPDCSFGGYQNPEFVPGGKALVLDRENQISSVDIASQEERQIVRNWTITMGAPTISPDGEWIAASLQCHPPPEIWRSRYAETQDPCAGQRVSPASIAATNPSWGPGAWIAYERGDEGRPHQIVVTNAETGDECVVAASGDNRNPRWAPEAFVPPR